MSATSVLRTQYQSVFCGEFHGAIYWTNTAGAAPHSLLLPQEQYRDKLPFPSTSSMFGLSGLFWPKLDSKTISNSEHTKPWNRPQPLLKPSELAECNHQFEIPYTVDTCIETCFLYCCLLKWPLVVLIKLRLCLLTCSHVLPLTKSDTRHNTGYCTSIRVHLLKL